MLEEELKSMWCGFYMKEVEDADLSKKAGSPIHVTVPFAKIKQAGDGRSEFHIRADEKYQYVRGEGGEGGYLASAKEVFAREWAAFEASGDGSSVVGTPIAQMAGMTPARAADLRALGIMTVQLLAELPDNKMKRVGMDADGLRERARKYLADSTEALDFDRISTENAELRARLEALEAQASVQSVEASGDIDLNPKFDEWEAPELQAYILDSTGTAPHPNCSLDTLRRKASEAAAKITAAAA